MPIKYKINILEALKAKGYTPYKLRKMAEQDKKERECGKKLEKEFFLGEATIQKLRENKPISFQSLGFICQLLECQPADLIEYTPNGSSL